MSQIAKLVQAAPLVKTFQTPGEAIREVAVGLCHAGVVRGYIDRADADKQADAILRSYDKRKDGVPGGTLGPSLFEHHGNPMQYFRECARSGARIDAVLGETHPAKLIEAIESFESLGHGYRIRPVVFRGLPAAYNRALIFKSDAPVIVKIHEDVANVRALAPHKFEIAETEIVMAHNLYLRNRTGEGSLFMYGKRFSDEEKRVLDLRLGPKSEIATTGYPYPESAFHGSPITTLAIETGDYVVFRADYPHKVGNTKDFSDGYRVSWNGFLTLLHNESTDLVYWT